MRIRIFFFSLAVLGLFSCKPDEPAPIIPPQVSTLEAMDITYNSALVGGKILEQGSEPITRKGVCFVEAITNTPEEFANTWPTINNNVIEATGDDLTFTVLMGNLKPNKTYYLRAFAESLAGLKYGEKIKFTTEFETITDIDGNVYRIWTIGNQTWTIDNFNATRLRNGSPIPNRVEDSYWGNTAPQEPAMCWYNNDRATHEKDYGALYNWYAASHPLIAPEGWRVPTFEDYRDLKKFIDGGDIISGSPAGGKMKMVGNEFWEAPNTGATNETGFSAKAAGWRGPYPGTEEVVFYSLKYVAHFFYSSEFGGYGEGGYLIYNTQWFHYSMLYEKYAGFSLRLIKNED